jgi:uncharacterized protein (DUF2249 family)
MRECSRCKRTLPAIDFGKSKNGPSGLNYWCKACVRENSQDYRQRLKREIGEDGYLAKRRQYYIDKHVEIQKKRSLRQQLRREHFTKQSLEWQKTHPAIVRVTKKKAREKNIDKIITYTREYHATHKSQRNAQLQKRKAIDPPFKLQQRMRSTFADKLRTSIDSEMSAKIRRQHSVMKLVGCSVMELMRYLEERFQPGMSWKNWGRGRTMWHIDHIRPISSFDLSREDHLRTCWHFTNLQPLWERDNLRKSDTWDSAS